MDAPTQALIARLFGERPVGRIERGPYVDRYTVGDADLLIERRRSPRGSPLAIAHAAAASLDGLEAIAHEPGYFSPGGASKGFDVGEVWTTRVVAAATPRHPDPATAVRQVLDALGEERFAWFGHEPVRTMFAPGGASWATAWSRQVDAQATAVRADGRATDARVDALVARARAALPAMVDVAAFTVVHGRLSPDVLRVDPLGVRVIGWDDACLGDPLVDLASAAIGLARVHQRLDRPLSASERARLDGYVAAQGLCALARASAALVRGCAGAAAAFEDAWTWTGAWMGAGIAVDAQELADAAGATVSVDRAMWRAAAEALLAEGDPVSAVDGVCGELVTAVGAKRRADRPDPNGRWRALIAAGRAPAGSHVGLALAALAYTTWQGLDGECSESWFQAIERRVLATACAESRGLRFGLDRVDLRALDSAIGRTVDAPWTTPVDGVPDTPVGVLARSWR